MTSDATDTASTDPTLSGPVRYSLAIVISHETDEVVTITVNGLTAPRIGERLYFEVPQLPLSVKVVDVAHWFYAPANDPDHRETVVTAVPHDVDMPVARKLLDSEVLEQWCTYLPSVGPSRK
ncbi:hypothetical protein [Nocardia farcinica]|uniref:hypothetical protein n=1 Tax=Nocardia farcinica TaxID=37329 RepID=UPI002457BD0D|nr:hypothetical protein [Nocardia farcinica]